MVTNYVDFSSAINFKTNVADHLGQLITLKRQVSPIPERPLTFYYKRFFHQDNLYNLKHFLSTNDLSCLYTNKDVNGAWNYFHETLLYLLELTCPVTRVKTYQSQSKSMWINPDIIRDSEELKDLFWLSNNTNSLALAERYREAKQSFKTKIQATKKNFFQQKIINAANTTKAIWQIVNSNLGRVGSNVAPSTINSDASTLTDPLNIANLFCDFFANDIESKLANIKNVHVKNLIVPDTNLSSIYMPQIELSEIYGAIKSLKNKKACCSNEDVPIFALEYIWDFIKYPLCYLYNLFLQSGLFPERLKLGEVVPFYKKGDIESVENYRPVTGLLSFSKIFEKILAS